MSDCRTPIASIANPVTTPHAVMSIPHVPYSVPAVMSLTPNSPKYVVNTSLNAKYPYESKAFNRYTKRNSYGARFKSPIGRVSVSGHRITPVNVTLFSYALPRRRVTPPDSCSVRSTRENERNNLGAASREATKQKPRLRPRRFRGRRSACARSFVAREKWVSSDARMEGRNCSAGSVTRVLTESGKTSVGTAPLALTGR
mmetsp:Transcript_7765/g.29049  ORF Transcript_7765/g.29049 Transcript_7765/m.29049 type:complete len:200 (+) Transcript_7765:3332-3931(+)